MTAPPKPASRAQLTYLIGLVDQRQLVLDLPETLTMDQARELIGYALTQPKPAPPHLAPGFYRDGDDVYRVRHNKDRTGTYAARLMVNAQAAYVTAIWEYAPGWAGRLTPEDALTVSEAARLGHHHGVCVVCRKRFTDPFSARAGLDAQCRDRLKGTP